MDNLILIGGLPRLMNNGIILCMIGILEIALFTILLLPANLDAQTNSSLYRNYTNSDFNVRMEYPANWTASEINLQPNEVVNFYPKEFEEEYVLPVSFDLTIFDNYSWSSFDEYFESAAQHYNGLEDIRIINESRTTLAERPAYNITYYDYRSGNYKVMDVSTYAGDEDIILGYIAEPGYFNKYLPGANKIINSFQLTNTTN